MSDARRKRHLGTQKNRMESGGQGHRSQAGPQVSNHRSRNNNAHGANVSTGSFGRNRTKCYFLCSICLWCSGVFLFLYISLTCTGK